MIDLITGGSGFIGSHLTEALLLCGNKVRILDIQPWKYEKHPNLEAIECDIRGALPSFFGVDRVFHLAALADIVPSIDRPIEYYDTNVTGTLNVLEASRKYKISKFIYASSSSCYGIANTPTPEHADIAPQYPYALTKYMGEQLVTHWSQVYKIPAVSLRIFNAYGPRHRSNGAYGAMLGTFLAQRANDKPLTIVGDGTQQRDFIHVSDVSAAFIAAADHGDGVYNVGSGSPESVNYIAKRISGDRVCIPKRPGEPDITCADINKIKRETGWRPAMSIETGIDEMVKNLAAYKDCPVWEPHTIDEATKTWFEALS